MTDPIDIVERLREATSAGYDEWRVQDPKDGAYCIAYSWPGVANPEREARKWLATQNTKYPRGRYADYVVACVRVVPLKDRLLAEAAAEIKQLRADLATSMETAAKGIAALSEVVNERAALAQPAAAPDAATIRAQALEDAAKVCDVTPPYPFRPSIEAAHAIRKLAAAPQAPQPGGAGHTKE